MSTVSTIWVRITADTRGLQSGLAKSGAELKAFQAASSRTAAATTSATAKMGSTFSSVGSSIKALSPAFVVLGGIAVAAISKGISSTQQWAGEVRSLQRVTGLSAESASGLAASANTLGISVDQLGVGFGLLGKNIVNGSAKLEQYGIVTKDTEGRVLPFEEILGNVSDKFLTLQEGPEQAAFAMNIFGRSGKTLIPILARGSAGLEELRKKAEEAGLIMSQQDLDASRQLTIAQRQLGEAFKGASISIGKAFIPALTTLTNALTFVVDLFEKIPVPVKAAVLGITVLTGVIAGLQLIGNFFVGTWTRLLTGLGLTGPAGTAAAGGVTEAGVASAAATAPTVALTAAVTALTAAMEAQTVSAAVAAESVAGFGVASSGLLVPTSALAGAEVALGASGEVAAAGMGTASAATAGLGATIATALPWLALIAAAIAAVAFVIYKNWDTIKKAAAPFIAQIIDAFNELKSAFADAFASLSDAFHEIWVAIQPLMPAIKAVGAVLLAIVAAPVVVFFEMLIYSLKALALYFRLVADAADWFITTFGPAIKEAVGLAVKGINLLIAAYNALVPILNLIPSFHLKTVDALSLEGDAYGGAATAADDYTGALDKNAAAQRGLAGAVARAKEGLDLASATLENIPEVAALASSKIQGLGSDFHKLSEVSGQDFGKIKQDLMAALSDPATKVEDLPGIMKTALKSTRDAMKAWHDSIVQNFGGAGSALEQFSGQAEVSLDDASAALKDYTKQIRTFGKDTDTIQERFGKRASDFLQWAYSQGLAQAGLVHAVAVSNKANSEDFIKNWQTAQSATDRLATKIQKSFQRMTDDILSMFQKILNKFLELNGLDPIEFKADAHQAKDEITDVQRMMNDLPRHKYIDIIVRRHESKVHEGGLIMHAGGMVKRMHAPRFHDGGSTAPPPAARMVRRMHTGGDNLKADEVPVILQRGEYVIRRSAVQHVGIGFLDRVNRMHEGGQVPAPPPAARNAQGQPALTGEELTLAFRKALREEREKLYIDRRRFGRDLDYAVITDGHW